MASILLTAVLINIQRYIILHIRKYCSV